MRMSRSLRGALAGAILAAAALGTVAFAAPAEAHGVSFQISVGDRRPPVPRSYHTQHVRWDPGHWERRGHHWVWSGGHYEKSRHAPRHGGHGHWAHAR